MPVSEQDTPPGGPAEDQAWEEEPVALEAVRSLFVTLAKTFRAHQLYDENNPVRRRFVYQLRTEFLGLWKDLERLVVTIDEDHMYLLGSDLPLSEPRTIDLAEADSATGGVKRHIIKTTDPQKYGIRVSDYLIE
jgi:hypothetical protein